MHRRSGLSASLMAMPMMMPMAMLVLALAPGPAAAQEEFPPPTGKESGKAPLVVVFSGATGPGNYRVIASRIAALGYDVALFDSNAIMKARQQGRTLDTAVLGTAVKGAIANARRLPHALPGTIGVVGFSL